ncbi:MAG: VWA domain-containing protein [Pyrinomonadaceae bacterium]|nr:VWA domain-containing protein [Pyrinomonadaceae bacterium]
MSILDRLFGKPAPGAAPPQTPSPVADSTSHQLPSSLVAKEFGEVNVRKTNAEIQVQCTILMEPQGKEAEGWQTGVALDASASMKNWYGRMLEGKVPPEIAKDYEKRGWIATRVEDGRRVKSFQKAAYDDAIQKGYLKLTTNIVQPLAQEFIAYLAGSLDADGGTTVIYWACGDGSAFEVAGDFTADQCHSVEIQGPNSVPFGAGTILTPAVKYFVERFKDADRGMYVFLTDGRLDDLAEVKRYTTELAKEIAAGQRNSVKCVLIGLGDGVNEEQMEELDDLDTGTEIDIWDHKMAKEMRGLVEIFAEVVNENQIVAPTGTIYDSDGNIVKTYSDGVPAKIAFSLPPAAEWFELEVFGQKIRQTVLLPNK